MLARARKPYREIDAGELARVAGTVLHGGIAAIARPRPLGAFDPAAAPGWAQDGKPLLVLDGIGNPHNLGAIARTAAFFGIERMLLADRPEQALPSDASYRVAEGGLEHLTLYQAPLPAALAGLRQGYRIIGAALGLGAPPRETPRWQAAGPDLRQRGEGSRPGDPRRLRRNRDDPGQRPAAVAQCRRSGCDPDLPRDPPVTLGPRGRACLGNQAVERTVQRGLDLRPSFDAPQQQRRGFDRRQCFAARLAAHSVVM